MYRWFAFFTAGLMTILAGLAVWGCFGLNRHLILAIDRYGAAAPQAHKADAAIDALWNLLHATNTNLNRPCGGGEPCGTLATINKAVTKAGDSLVTTQLAERAAVPHVLSAVDSFGAAAQHIESTADASTGLLDAGTIALNRLPALEDASTKAVSDFDALASSKDLAGALQNINQVTLDSAAITGDFRNRFHDLLYPPPCTDWKCRFSRHVWPIIKDGATLGEASYWTWALGNQIKP